VRHLCLRKTCHNFGEIRRGERNGLQKLSVDPSHPYPQSSSSPPSLPLTPIQFSTPCIQCFSSYRQTYALARALFVMSASHFSSFLFCSPQIAFISLPTLLSSAFFCECGAMKNYVGKKGKFLVIFTIKK